jgi:RNA polymerase sigma-70 factor, ECF subfamily
MSNRQVIAGMPDGRELMNDVKCGSDGAFDRLALAYGSYIRNVIGRYVKEKSMVDDLAQDVLLRLYGSRERYQPAAPFEAFLQTIIFNLCVNHVRYHKRRRATSLSSMSDSGEVLGTTLPDLRGDLPEQDAMRHERAAAVRQAIRKLPTNQQRALMLSHFEGLAHDEIGRRVGLSVAAVKSLIWRARENLRRTLSLQLSDHGDARVEVIPGAAEPVGQSRAA